MVVNQRHAGGALINQLTPTQAKKIVDHLMKDIPHNVTIMNKEGYIIASGTKERIGKFNKSGKKAADTKETVRVFRDQCVNEPVIMDSQLIGVVEISGDPEEVGAFSKLLSSMVGMLLKEMEETERQKDRFLQRLIDHQSECYSAELIEVGMATFNMDISQKIVVAFYPASEQLDQLYKNNKSPIFKYQSGYLRFFYQHTFNKEQLLDVEAKRILLDDSSTVSESIHHLWLGSLFVSLFQIDTDHVIFVQDYPQFLVDYSSVKINPTVVHKVRELDEELKETLITFIKNNLIMKQTSETMHIHRNTLAYRLSRIEELTTLNPNQVMDLFMLVCALLSLHKEQSVK